MRALRDDLVRTSVGRYRDGLPQIASAAPRMRPTISLASSPVEQVGRGIDKTNRFSWYQGEGFVVGGEGRCLESRPSTCSGRRVDGAHRPAARSARDRGGAAPSNHWTASQTGPRRNQYGPRHVTRASMSVVTSAFKSRADISYVSVQPVEALAHARVGVLVLDGAHEVRSVAGVRSRRLHRRLRASRHACAWIVSSIVYRVPRRGPGVSGRTAK